MAIETDYLNQAKEILSGCLLIPKDNIPANADINALGSIDSLTFELIALEIEESLGHVVDPIALLEMRSVEDLARLLKNERT